MNICIKLHESDNVAVALREIKQGEEVASGVISRQEIPQGHKVALTGIPVDGQIVRYGVTLGYALQPIGAGEWVHESMMRLPAPPVLEKMTFATNIASTLPKAPTRAFWGYPDPNDGYAGTRNILALHTTVQCVAGVVNVALERMKRELLPRFPYVDDIVLINHAYGCGVAINAPEAVIPIRALRNLIKHPNFGGQVMCIALGCEKLTPEMLLEPEDNNKDNVLILQELHGVEAMIEGLMNMAEKKLEKLNQRRRQELPLSHLAVGLQCGGSDAFSGISANPSVGHAADLLVEAGATVLFSEVTEVRDGVHLLAQRCMSEQVGQKLVAEMQWYDNYLDAGKVDRSANPTPGNKKGGLSNIVEKAMGSITKSGSSPIVEVLSPAERPTKRGLIYAATPASDFVCGSCQLASGIGLQVFTTGRGTPYGLAAIPVVKVCTRNELKEQWPDLIDVNAGPVATGEATVQEIGLQMFHEIIRVASGEKKTFAEKYRLHNDFCIFNPAPIT